MKNAFFKVNVKSLPDEFSKLEWSEIPYKPWGNLPETPCVFVITKTEYGTLIPLDVCYTENLRRYFIGGDVKDITHFRAYEDDSSKIHYTIVDSESDRKSMRDRLNRFLGLEFAY